MGELTAEGIAPLITASLAPLLPGVSVADPALLKGGYSREMWAFDATLADGTRRPLILCADSAEGVVGSGDQALTRAQEAALLQLVHRAGLPVPEVLGAGDAASPMGRPYLVMERGAGTAAVGPLFRDPWYVARADELAARLAGILAAIHAVDATPVLGPPPRAADVAPRELARWSTELAATPQARTPVVDRAVAWLGAHLPPPPHRVTLVHADYRTGNVLHGHGDPGLPDGFRMVLDWEMAHLGDPIEDVAWAQLVCWRVGTGRVGALVEPARWRALYEQASGHAVDAAALRWWEVLGSVKMAFLLERAAARTEHAERALLQRLIAEIADELEQLLAGEVRA